METVLKMILIHDIVEIYAGDVPAYLEHPDLEKSQKERAAAEKVFSLLPCEQKKQYLDLWLEFEEGKTSEARYANVFDRFQGFLQNMTSDGHTWRKFRPNKEMVLQRMAPVLVDAPRLFQEIISPMLEEFGAKGILK
jgi:putative hydrolase of HD superfamily